MNRPVNRLSVVVPVYLGRPFLSELYERVRASAEAAFAEFELILVNDASPDDSWAHIVALCMQDKRVKGLNLSRNFGQHYAITAGLAHATGGWVVVMDCDLQDRPEEIPVLFAKAQEGYDSVFAQRLARQDTWVKRWQSKLFYALFSYLTDTKMDASVANFGMYHHQVVSSVLAMGDKLRYFPTMVQWVGFRKAYCPVRHQERAASASGYTLARLLRLAMDTILSFSEKPLRVCVTIGFIVTSASFLIASSYFVGALFRVYSVSGFASIMISLWFVAGVIMTMLGLNGVYLGKLFNQVKDRPVFIVAERLNLD